MPFLYPRARRLVLAIAVGAGAVSALDARAQSVAAQPPADTVAPAVISANRPGFGETADVSGRGVLQFESGIVLDGDHTAGTDTNTMSAPVSLVRFGISRHVEVQVASEGILSRSVATSSGAARISGQADVDLGLKAKVATEASAGINVAVLAALNFPTGADAFSSGGYDPSLKIAFGRSLPAGLSLGANVQVASTTVEGDRVRQHAFSAAVARGFAQRWSAFAEVFTIDTAPGAPATTSVDAGVSRIVGSNLQVDVSLGRGISRSATDWFVAFGFAVRHPGVFGRPRERP